MSNYHPFYHKIWEDKKFLEYDTNKRIVFIFLFTNHNCKISGIYEISPQTISNATNLTVDKVVEILESFDPETILYDFDKGIIYIKNFFKYNLGKIGNPITINKTVLQNVVMFPHKLFWEDFDTRYREDLKSIKERIKEIESRKKGKPNLKVVK